MKILIITKDTSLFDEKSPALEALKEAATLLEQIHVIVFTKKKEPYITKNISNKVFLYPTNSHGGWWPIFDAVSIAGSQVVFQSTFLADVIEAEDPFFAGAAAYILSRKYNRNYLINLARDLTTLMFEEEKFLLSLKRRMAEYVLRRADGIRVTSQSVGEAMVADMPELENKIYILAEPVIPGAAEDPSEKIDMRARYPDFNIFLLTSIEERNKINIRRMMTIMQNMRIRYPRIGLIAIDNHGYYKPGFGMFKPEEIPYIVHETGVRNPAAYYMNGQMFIDVSRDSRPGGAMTEAALSGCPIVTAPSAASAYIVRQGENGFIADPDNLAEFSGRIVEVFETPGLREKIKLFRHEVEQLTTGTLEQYFPTLLQIWTLVSNNEAPHEPDSLEQYTSDLVHSLTSTRKYIGEIREKIHEGAGSLSEKLKKDPLRPQHKNPAHTTIDYTENEILDVGHILGKK